MEAVTYKKDYSSLSTLRILKHLEEENIYRYKAKQTFITASSLQGEWRGTKFPISFPPQINCTHHFSCVCL